MISYLYILEGAARYAGLLLAPAEGFGLRPRPSADSFFCPSGKKNLFMSILAQILVIFGEFSLVYYRSLVYSYTWSRLCHHQIQLFSIHSSSISSSCPSPLVLCWKSRIWSINEFECLPVIWLIGGGINSPTSGWSGMHVKNLSSLALN